MKKYRISVTYVAVFAQTLRGVPALDNKFCKELFGMPYDTFNGLTDEGYVIAVENKPMPSITITPQRIVFKAQTVEELSRYVEAIAKEFRSKGIPMNSQAFGINSEYQWMEINSSSSEWMWNRFINPKMAVAPMNQCNRVSFRFVLNESESVNLDIMPRIGRNEGIFVSVNHHRATEIIEFPSQEQLKELFDDSEKLLNEKFFSTIIE